MAQRRSTLESAVLGRGDRGQQRPKWLLTTSKLPSTRSVLLPCQVSHHPPFALIPADPAPLPAKITTTDGTPLSPGGDDGRAVIWFDIDNCLCAFLSLSFQTP